MKIAALLLCAGNGTRFASPIPKQFHRLLDKKIYRYPLDVLVDSKVFCEIRIIAQKDHLPYLDSHPACTIIEGGKTRQESVEKGLQGLDADYVVICEGARPFLTTKLLQEHIEKLTNGAVAVNTCIPCTDTINIHKNGVIHKIPDREQFLHGQTPQSFKLKALLQEHTLTKKTYTDDCSLMLDANFTVEHVKGCEKNLKITTLHDLEVAKLIATFPCKSADFSV